MRDRAHDHDEVYRHVLQRRAAVGVRVRKDYHGTQQAGGQQQHHMRRPDVS